MDALFSLLQNVKIDPQILLKSVGILTAGSLLLSTTGKFVFGKKSCFSHAVSATMAIVFVYAVAMVVYSAFAEYKPYIPPLPYVTLYDTQLVLFRFFGSHYTTICAQILSMIILAFLANLLDSCIPTSKNPILWLLSRSVTVIGAIILQLLANDLLAKYLPADLMLYAPTILLGLLVTLLLVGALKILVGALLTTVHPLIGAFYTFFFATLIGRSLTKATITTALLTLLVLALNYIGCTAISIVSGALIAYIPLAVLLALLWYLANRILQ